MIKNQPGSMTILVLIMLTIMTTVLLVTMQIISTRAQMIAYSLKAEQEERLCTALADIGICAAEYCLLHDDSHERTVHLTVAIPERLAAGYAGTIDLELDKPVRVDAQLWQDKKLSRRIKALVSIDQNRKITQVLEWLLITV